MDGGNGSNWSWVGLGSTKPFGIRKRHARTHASEMIRLSESKQYGPSPLPAVRQLLCREEVEALIVTLLYLMESGLRPYDDEFIPITKICYSKIGLCS